MAQLFQCTFPFTVANPYTPTSSDVPDELFFGRRRAMEQIADLHGTNLVFGGRQLGKTALLREVKRRYQAPRRGQYVVWIDIKAAEKFLNEMLTGWKLDGNARIMTEKKNFLTRLSTLKNVTEDEDDGSAPHVEKLLKSLSM